MAIVRRATGPTASFTAVWSQVHPVFMLPPIAASWFGAVLATEFELTIGLVHSLAIFAAVYTAHVKDGYVDFYVRGEDDTHPLTERGCGICLLGATLVFVCSLLLLWWLVGIWAALITLPCWVIGYLHAPQLDMHPLGATMGYPVGIGLATIGGYFVQTMAIDPVPLAIAAVLIVLLAGIKIVDDTTDVSYDTSIGKPTVAVILGPDTARRVALGCMVVALGLTTGGAIVGLLPTGTLGAVVVFAPILVVANRKNPATATALLIRGAYLFFAGFIAATWIGSAP